jgi:peptidoglycan hydrolase-like protein with peptidoglycan-binding domain
MPLSRAGFVFGVATTLAAWLAGAAIAHAVGPSFPCYPAPRDALARLACSDPSLGEADLRMVQAYYALRASVGDAERAALKSRFLQSVVSARARCGLPPVEPLRDQAGDTVPAGAADCVASAYDALRADWTARLAGPAAEEAARAPRRNVEIQAKLQGLGFVPGKLADGVFGTATRDGIRAWQKSAHRPETGFLSDADASVLEGADWPEDRKAEGPATVKPLAGPLGFDGKPVEVSGGGVTARLSLEPSSDAAACGLAQGNLFGNDIVEKPPCRVVRLSVTVAGSQVLSAGVYALGASEDAQQFQISAQIVRLDPATREPQVLVIGYSGGAHCCTGAEAATEVGGTWKMVPFGSRDGDPVWPFVEAGGGPVFVGEASGFGYRFASYAGSYAPTLVQQLRGGEFADVTRDPRYHDLLLGKLREMEAFRAAHRSGEENGYLAGWVAQKALVGQLPEAWRAMEATFDRNGDPVARCEIAKETWLEDAQGNTSCPDGGQENVPFPTALAVFLVEGGYVTKAESAGLGYDVDRIEAGRKERDAAATARWKRHLAEDWFVLTRSNGCTALEAGGSPADKVTADRLAGIGDEVDILDRADGKPTQVVVGKPQGGGIMENVSFFRGLQRCRDGAAARNRQVEELR